LFGFDIGYSKRNIKEHFYWITQTFHIGLLWYFKLDYQDSFFIGLYEHFILDYSGISNWIIKNFFIGILWYFKLDYSEVFNWITWHASLSLPPAQTMALAFQGKLSPNI
jgi:hypothetical protein